MNTVLQQLVELQEIDKVILRIQRKIAEFPEIIQQLEKHLQDSEQKLTELHVSLEKQEKARRSKELEVETNIAQIKKYQGQLLQVKTNKEYSALLSEIKGLKSKNSLTEDAILELMEGIERTKKSLADFQKDLAGEKSRVDQEKQRQEAEQKEFQQVLDAEQKKHEALSGTIEESLFNEYAKLLTLRNGIVVTPVTEGGVCTGCHVALTPQMFAEIKSGEYLHRCPTCFRFLYWPDSHDQGEEE